MTSADRRGQAAGRSAPDRATQLVDRPATPERITPFLGSLAFRWPILDRTAIRGSRRAERARRWCAAFVAKLLFVFLEISAANSKQMPPQLSASVPAVAQPRPTEREKSRVQSKPSLRFHRAQSGSAVETRHCHAATTTHRVNEVAGIRELQLILAAHQPDTRCWYHVDKVPYVTLEDAQIDPHVHDVPER